MIISIENHCNSPNRGKMAEIFVNKEKELYRDNEECKDDTLPLRSPEQLKGKIVLKGKCSEVEVKVENCMDLDIMALYEGFKQYSCEQI